MLYLSAQPDEVYFTWQLELQLRNFHSLGITKENIHVLFAYDKIVGPNPLLDRFILENNDLANIFFYPDARLHRVYPSSVRPNIIKQHFSTFRDLSNHVVYYHDSDILLSRIPEIEDVYDNDICYVSDTSGYLDSNYIKSYGSEALLVGMADIVGLDVKEIESNDSNVGGAQYILKNITEDFWAKVEADCENLYSTMQFHNIKRWEEKYLDSKEFRSCAHGIQAWCADMWSLLWNLWLTKRTVRIHDEMVFSWPGDHISMWKKNSILHYSGSQKDDNLSFRKTDYCNFPPWYDQSLTGPTKENCCTAVVEAIMSRKDELDNNRKDLSNVCFVLEISDGTENAMRMMSTVKSYLLKYFKCSVEMYSNKSDGEITFPMETLTGQGRIDTISTLPDDVTDVIYLPAYTILSEKLILSLVHMFKSSNNQICSIAPRYNYAIDQLFFEAFSKTLDIEILEMNLGKFFKGRTGNKNIMCMQRSLIKDLEIHSSNSILISDIFNGFDLQRKEQNLELDVFTLHI